MAEDDDIDNYTYKTKDKNITEACKQIVAWLSGKQGEAYKESHIY